MTGIPGQFVDGYFVEWTGATPGGIDDGSTDEGETGGGNDTENRFPTEFTWPSIKLNFNDGHKEYVQSIKGTVKAYRLTELEVGENFEEFYVPYKLTKLTINSCNTGSDPGGDCRDTNWKDEIYDDRYGGVFLFTERTPVNKNSGETSECGTVGGVVNGIESGYTYGQVFDESDMRYLLKNSMKSDGEVAEVVEGQPFLTSPVYDDVEDKFNKKAPIYPMDAIISFIPDERDTVYVKYNVSMKASVNGVNVPLENGNITIVHEVIQDTDNFGEAMDDLMDFCNFFNSGEIEDEDFSEGYPINYPYTIVSDTQPTERFTDGYSGPISDGEIERGDVWYNPSTDERLYFDKSDVPDDVEIYSKKEGSRIKDGRAYKTATGVQTVFDIPDKEKCNNRPDTQFPYGLKVDITQVGRKGAIKEVKINKEDNYGKVANYTDGDVLLVPGGNGNAKLRVIINEKTKWIEEYRQEEF